MEGHGVPLGTLKECFMFLQWLKTDEGMQGQVTDALFARIYTYYNNPGFRALLPSSLNDFLRNVSELHGKISKNADPGDYKDTNPDEIVKAFSECLPKVHAVFSLLLFHVDYTYTPVGGGKWALLDTITGGSLGNGLKMFFTGFNGVIDGGFKPDELQNVLGKTLAYNLNNALERYISTPDLFTSVLFNNLVKDDWHNLDAGNVLLLLWAFCGYVQSHEKDSGGLRSNLETELRRKNMCFDWDALVRHCKVLDTELSKLFGSTSDDGSNPGPFSTTGRAFTPHALRPDAFAGAFEKWFKDHWTEMTETLEIIKGSVEDYSDDPNSFEPESIYPYGIVLNQNKQNNWVQGLKDLPGVLDALGNEHGGGLKTLKTILGGQQCPAQPLPKRPEAPPAQTKTDSARPVATKTEATKAEAAKPTATGDEGAQNQGKKSEGAQNQGKKAEGAQNQGKKAADPPNQSDGQSRDASSVPPVVKSAVTPSPGAPGGQGPQGPKGDKGNTGPQGPPPPPPTPPQVKGPTKSTSASGSSSGSTGDQVTGQNAGQDASHQITQLTSQAPGQTPSSGVTTSVATASGGGGSGASRGGNGGSLPAAVLPPPLPKPDPKKCDDGSDAVFFNGVKLCQPKEQRDRAQKFHDDFQKRLQDAKELKKQEEEAERKRQDAIITEHPLVKASDYYYHYRPHYYKIPSFLTLANDGGAVLEGVAQEDTSQAVQDVNKKLRNEQDRWDRYYVQQEHDKIELQRRAHKEREEFLRTSAARLAAAQSAKRQQTYDDNINRRVHNASTTQMPPQPPTIEPAAQLSHTLTKQPTTMMLDYSNIADITHVTGEDIKTEPNKFPTAEAEEDLTMKVSLASQLQGHPVSTSLQSAQVHSQKVREANELWEIFKKERNERRDEKVKKIVSERENEKKEAEDIFRQKKESGQKLHYADAVNYKNQIIKNLRGGEVYISGPPSPKTEKEEIDLRIDVSKPIVQDPVYDWHFDEDSMHIQDDILSNTVAPYKSAVSLNVLPPEAEQLPPPTTDFNPDNIIRQNVQMCIPDWSTQKPTHDATDIPETELFPAEAPRTVRDMLIWLVGLQNPKHHVAMEKCINDAFKNGIDVSSDLRLSVNGADISPENVLHTIKLAAMFAASVLSAIALKWGVGVSSVTLASKDSDQSKDPDCCALLCQLRDYAYACHHQLTFLKSQCSRGKYDGGWRDYPYGCDVSSNSPLQAFLTDALNSEFETHPFDPRNICLKSRVNMGFSKEDLPTPHETGKHISTILTTTCGGEDPLLTLCSYLNCLTRRTPRTTGELVSFFHNFGNDLHKPPSQFSKLGSALSTRHRHCPDWDCLGAADLRVITDALGSAPPSSNHHDNDHPNTLSTLLGCGIYNVDCPQHLSPITHRAYALYSHAFAHTYLSWAVYLAGRLWESLLKLHCDLENLQCHDSGSKHKSLNHCDKAMPLLYLHGITPPDGVLQPSLTCSQVIAKLSEVVAGEPIASLMTAMDNFLYGIRAPFLYSVFTLWLIAALYIAHSLLYRLDVLRFRSHLLTTRASHLVDVKALLTKGRKVLSLYHGVDYFDDPADLLEVSIIIAFT
ncbi:Ribosome-binding protein 1 [Babesia ovata]|uniref:Ribosome-binding protein 1 n=1 Tax=Babesia ovata TaxID=189622 RepID=A0A2H6K6G9_9APIC|nr:Ribosome-binding protein 1 [Babesia ovata]GBE58594.1 Ribosome-binding protein 1 [Babesia ovata]